MKKYKYISIAVILIMFVLFSCTQIFKQSSYNVLNVINPFEIILDKNNNGCEDDNETVKLLNGYEIITKDSSSDKLTKSLNIDEYTKYAFAYLTEKYSKEILTDKKIIYNKDGITVSGENYLSVMQKSGYLFKNGKPVNPEAYKKRLEQIKKADYKIYNLKSNKYHNLTCEYGRSAHNYVLLAKSQLPKGAKPCKSCIGDNKKRVSHSKHKEKSISCRCPKLVYSKGAIKIILNDYTQHLIPNRFGNSEICNELVKQINNAKSTIDIAIYGYDRVPKVEKALKKAIARGVKVRLVYDIDANGKNIYAHTNELVNIIKNAVNDKASTENKNSYLYTNSIMHNKFYIFDNSVVITGSANMSFTDMSDFNSNAVILINSAKIANIYTQEFNQMYNSKFHNLKEKVTGKENILLGNTNLSVYFSPKDNIIKTVLLPLINNSKKYIYMPVFLITDSNLSNALINAKKRGVDVKVIVDATNAKNSYSKHKTLRQYGILVKTENWAGKLHSKSIIIDDKYTIIGSMNFSKSGETKNDENLVVIKDSDITKFYKAYFIYLWNRINNYWATHDVSSESVYSIGSCSDGIDNDYDGKTDMDDDGCKFKPKVMIK